MLPTPAVQGTAAADPAARSSRTYRWCSVFFSLLSVLCLPRLGHAAADSSGTRIAALAEQLAHAHVPYRSGGTGRHGLDCSGLVWYVHHQIGVRVPRRAQEQFAAAAPVKLSELTPGDLLFFRLRNSRRIDHVGIYAAPGELIHASIRRHAVTLAHLDERYFRPRVVSAGRLWDKTPTLASSGPASSAAAQDGAIQLF